MGQEDARIGYLLKRTQQSLRYRMDSELKDLELSTPQYSVLSTLERLGSLSNSKLAEECFVTAQTMIRIIKHMTESGLVQKIEHPTHGKIINIVLSQKGGKLLKKAHTIVNKVQTEMLKNINKKEQEQIQQYLKRLNQNLATFNATSEG